MLEEQFRSDLMYILELYSQKGLSLGTEFYIYKDVFNELSKTYNNFIQMELQKQKEEQEKKEENEE